MNETTKKIIKTIIIFIVFAVCLVLVIKGQRNVGPTGLLTMLAGMAGLIVLLWLYNRQFK